MNFAGLPIYVALQPVDMRMGFDRLGGMVRERMNASSRMRALFVFVSKRGHSMKILTWDGTGDIIVSKRLDVGGFDLPLPTMHGQEYVVVNDALFAAIFVGNGKPRRKRKKITH